MIKGRTEEATPPMSITMARCSTEDHGHHLAGNEAALRETTLRLGQRLVKTPHTQLQRKGERAKRGRIIIRERYPVSILWNSQCWVFGWS